MFKITNVVFFYPCRLLPCRFLLITISSIGNWRNLTISMFVSGYGHDDEDDNKCI